MSIAVSLFFPEGISPLGQEHDFEFGLATFQCNPITNQVTLSSGEIVSFTLQNYATSSGCSRLKLYLTTCRNPKKENVYCKIVDDDIVSDDDEYDDDHFGDHDAASYSKEQDNNSKAQKPDEFEPADNDTEEALLMEDCGLIGTNKQRTELREQQNKEFEDSLKKDIEKELVRQEKDEAEKIAKEKLEQTKNACALRTPTQPSINDPHIAIRVQHIDAGLIKRRFPKEENMSAVYDWVGSMETSPHDFYLRNFQNKIFLPTIPIECAVNETLYMKKKDPFVMLDDSDDEVCIKDHSLVEPILIANPLPGQLLEDDLR